MKRLFDIVASGCGLVVLSPLFLILAIWIKFDSKGPVFYRQVRVGRGNNDYEAKIRAAYDILRFMLYDDDEEEKQEVYYCPYCGSEKDSEDEICPVCFDDDD